MSTQQQDPGLILGDRINWPYLLAMSVIKVDEAIVREEGRQSEQQVREAALALYDKIPEAWVAKDEKWREDLKHAIEEVEVDDRPLWCGVRVGSPRFRKEEKINPHRLLRACINVFNRRGLLSKTIFQEVMIPIPADFEEGENADSIDEDR